MHAKEQYEVYKTLVRVFPRFMDYLYPKYMLLCNCIELSLKAVLLRNKMYTPKELKEEFGHNIIKLAEEVNKSTSIPNFNKYELTTIEVLSPYHEDRLFIYPLKGKHLLPKEKDIVVICERLIW